jgi:hypothetical protein
MVSCNKESRKTTVSSVLRQTGQLTDFLQKSSNKVYLSIYEAYSEEESENYCFLV